MSSTCSSSSGKRPSDGLFVSEDELSDIDDGPDRKRVKRGSNDIDSVETSSVTSSDEEDEDDQKATKYDASSEAKPRLAIYHESFAKAERDVVRACKVISDTNEELIKEGYKNEEIVTVCGESGLEALNPPSRLYPKVHPVAVLGPAGSGKSSAMNSILSQKKAAFEHDGDNRGTYVMHEYRTLSKEQVTRYEIQVPFYSRTAIRKDVNRRCSDIWDFHQAAASGDEESDEEQALQQKHDTGIEYFHDLLCDLKDFETKEATANYFDSRSDMVSKPLFAEVCGLVETYLASLELEDDNKRYTAHTEDELHQIFKQVSRPTHAVRKKDKQPSPWPLIRKVMIHQRADLLDSGVVLADTPGIDDTNLAVVENTKRYLRMAGTIMIFLHYKRVKSNTVLSHMLQECIAIGKMHNIKLVITHIDEMKSLSADERDGYKDVELAPLAEAEANQKRVNKAIKETKIAKQKAKGVNSIRYAESVDRLEELEAEKARAKAAVTQASILIRCDRIGKGVEDSIKEIEKSRYAPKLPVYFISNTQYQKHVDGYDAKEPPTLDIEATGIPALRRLLYGIPAQGKLTALRTIHDHRLEGILNGIVGILTKSKLERKAEVLMILNEGLGKPDLLVKDLCARVRSAFEKKILDFIEKEEDDWKIAADNLVCKVWASLNATTFNGVCTRGGKWDPHKVHGRLNFHLDLLKIFDKRLAAAFNELDGDVEVIDKDFLFQTEETFASIQVNIEKNPDAQGQDLAAFFELIGNVKSEITEKIRGEVKKLRASISDIRHAATLNSDHSYTKKVMEKTWEDCVLTTRTSLAPKASNTTTTGTRKRYKKPTVGGNRLMLIHNRVQGQDSNNSLFESIGKAAKADLDTFLEEWQTKCKKTVEDGYEKIKRDFQNRYQEADVKQEQDPRAVAKLFRAASTAREILDGNMRQHLFECHKYENETEALKELKQAERRQRHRA